MCANLRDDRLNPGAIGKVDEEMIAMGFGFEKVFHTLLLRPNAPQTIKFKNAAPGGLRQLEVLLLWADTDGERVGLDMSEHGLPYECEVRTEQGQARRPTYRKNRVLIELDVGRSECYIASSDRIDGHCFVFNDRECPPARFVDNGVVLTVLEYARMDMK